MIKLGKNVKLDITVEDVMANDFPELWQSAKEVVEKLVKLQGKLIEELKTCEKQLPKSFEELKEEEAQMRLMDYIRLRSLSAFAEELSKLIDEQCRNLVNSKNENDQDAVDTAMGDLKHTLESASAFPFDEIAADRVNGFFRLNELLKMFLPRLEFMVFTEWSYRDITGAITDRGLSHVGLWKAAINDTVPKCSSISGLLADNEIIRIY